MAVVFMTDPVTGRCVLYAEPFLTGSPSDRLAARNLPLVDPIGWLPYVYFCSDFDYYQVAVGPTGVTVSQAAVATSSTPISLGPYTYTLVGTRAETTYLLATHGLGYVPQYMVIYAGRLLTPSTFVKLTSGQVRVVTPYATATEIRLHEVALVDAVSMSAENYSYTVVVFKQPVASGTELLGNDPSTGTIRMGKNKFDSSLPMLRRSGVGGDTPFDIITAPYIDISNGRIRQVFPGGIVIDESGYDGLFSGSSSFQGAIA